MSVEYRPYQSRAHVELEAAMARKNGPSLLVVPTGGGKTVIGAGVINSRVERSQRAIFVAPRREIVDQTAEKLADFGIDPGIIMAGRRYYPSAGVQVASVDTLRSWVNRGKITLSPADLLAIDEAHRSMGETYQWLINAYVQAGADVFGLTATPLRADGVGLGRTYKNLILGPSMPELIREGSLVQPEYFVAFVPDLTGVKVSGGDFDDAEIEEIMNQKHLVGDVVQNWIASALNTPTLVFASGVKHSIALAEHFREAGFNFAHIDGDTPTSTRREMLNDLRRGALMGITNCNVFSEGTDIPIIQTIVDAGVTKSLTKHIQKLGRGARPYPGKLRYKVFDHAGNFYRNGRIDRVFPWALDEGREMVEKVRALREKERVSFTCSNCQRVFSHQLYCPRCGTQVQIRGAARDVLEAQLVALTAEQFHAAEQAMGVREKRQFYREVLGYCLDKGKKPGYAYHCFADKFKGETPPRDWMIDEPLAPSHETRAWLKSRQIRNAKRAQKQRLTGSLL